MLSLRVSSEQTKHYIGEKADAADAKLEQALEPPRDGMKDLDLPVGQRLALFREWSGVGEVCLHDWHVGVCK